MVELVGLKGPLNMKVGSAEVHHWTIHRQRRYPSRLQELHRELKRTCWAKRAL